MALFFLRVQNRLRKTWRQTKDDKYTRFVVKEAELKKMQLAPGQNRASTFFMELRFEPASPSPPRHRQSSPLRREEGLVSHTSSSGKESIPKVGAAQFLVLLLASQCDRSLGDGEYRLRKEEATFL